MRVAIVIYSLGAGGAERVAAGIASHWAENGWIVSVFVFAGGMNSPFYQLHPSVEYHAMGIASGSVNLLHGFILNISRIKVLRRSLSTFCPDFIVSFMSEANVVTLLAAAGLGTPVVVREANDPFHEPLGAIWKFLRHITYAFADCVILLNEQSRSYFSAAVRRRIEIIPNAVADVSSVGSRCSSRKLKTITAVGRLVNQKGFDILLEAFGLVAWKHPEWHLQIVGGGPLLEALQTQIRTLGLTGRASLEGVTKDVSATYQNSDVFVMSSRFEGFPNSLCEAMASGLPVISFNCPTGPSVIVRHGTDGLLVPPGDTWALADAMEVLILDISKREAYGRNAKEISQRYSRSRVMRKWDEIVVRIVK